jgi:hypothetical protein
MADDVFHLFDEFAASYARGERPDPRGYLVQAGEGHDELASMIERFVQATPPPPPSEETLAMVSAWVEGEPPLLELRRRRGLKRETVVDALVRGLGIADEKREKVAGYYHELETGQLETARVDRRVFDALAQALRARVEDLAAWRSPPMPASRAYHRVTEQLSAPAPSMLAPASQAEEWDEVDRLFRGNEP